MFRLSRRLRRAFAVSAVFLVPAGAAFSQLPGLPLRAPAPGATGAPTAAPDTPADGSTAGPAAPSLAAPFTTGRRLTYRFDPHDRTTPRRTAVGFLAATRAGDFERAAGFLDLSEFPEVARPAEGPLLARRLKFVLDRFLWIDPASVSDVAEGDTDDEQPVGVDLLGYLPLQGAEAHVLLEQQGVDSRRDWLIAAPTVAVIDALYQEHGYPWLDRVLPSFLLTARIGNLLLWQALGLIALAVAAWYLAQLIGLALRRPLQRLAEYTSSPLDDDILKAVGPPFRLFIAVWILRIASRHLFLSFPVVRVLLFLTGALTVLAIVWFLLRLIDTLSEHAEERCRLEGNRGMLSLVPMLRRGAKVGLLLLTGTIIAQSYGVNVTALLAGAGVAGLAVAFAAQKTIENLFGGVSVILDQPVRVGDFCKVGAFQGTVEDIGLRSTRLRTVDRTVVSVPNAQFSTEVLENLGARDRIRLYQVLNLRYETTPDQLRWLLAEIRRLVYSHPMIGSEGARVRLVNFGPSSLDVEIFCFVKTTDFPTFTAVREDVFLRLMDLVNASGSGFAFPSQTLYFGRDPGVDAGRTQAAQAQVAGWREQGTLPFPDFPEGEIRAFEGSLPYPPKGSGGSAP